VQTEFWWGDLRQRGPLEELGKDDRIILHRMFKEWDGVWTEFI
jgi:hypothetical protein